MSNSEDKQLKYVHFCGNCAKLQEQLNEVLENREEDRKFWGKEMQLTCMLFLIGGVLLGTLMGAALVSN